MAAAGCATASGGGWWRRARVWLAVVLLLPCTAVYLSTTAVLSLVEALARLAWARAAGRGAKGTRAPPDGGHGAVSLSDDLCVAFWLAYYLAIIPVCLTSLALALAFMPFSKVREREREREREFA